MQGDKQVRLPPQAAGALIGVARGPRPALATDLANERCLKTHHLQHSVVRGPVTVHRSETGRGHRVARQVWQPRLFTRILLAHL